MNLESHELSPDARREFDEAVDWYRARSPETADRFVEAVRAAIRRIAEAPHRWPLNEARNGRQVLQSLRLANHDDVEHARVRNAAIVHGPQQKRRRRRACTWWNEGDHRHASQPLHPGSRHR